MRKHPPPVFKSNFGVITYMTTKKKGDNNIWLFNLDRVNNKKKGIITFDFSIWTVLITFGFFNSTRVVSDMNRVVCDLSFATPPTARS